MTEPVVLIEPPAPGVGLVRINRPDARNALNMEVRRRIVDALNEMTENGDIRAIVLTGHAKAFASRAAHKLRRAIYACPKPVIAAVSGLTLGGACQLAMTCDIIIAGESAKFGQ